jgi:hypothetical protein
MMQESQHNLNVIAGPILFAFEITWFCSQHAPVESVFESLADGLVLGLLALDQGGRDAHETIEEGALGARPAEHGAFSLAQPVGGARGVPVVAVRAAAALERRCPC